MSGTTYMALRFFEGDEFVSYELAVETPRVGEEVFVDVQHHHPKRPVPTRETRHYRVTAVTRSYDGARAAVQNKADVILERIGGG